MLFSSSNLKADNMNVDKLLSCVKQNINRVRELQGDLNISYNMGNTILQHKREILYKKPNRFRMVTFSTSGVQLITASSNGEEDFLKSNSFDNKIVKHKYSKGNDYFLFKLYYGIDYNYLFDNILKKGDINITENNDQVYKIEISIGKDTGAIWVDYKKAIIVKMNFNFIDRDKILFVEIKDYGKYEDIYLPLEILAEEKTSKYSIIKNSVWENVTINNNIDNDKFNLK